jgi:hypothetical protein
MRSLIASMQLSTPRILQRVSLSSLEIAAIIAHNAVVMALNDFVDVAMVLQVKIFGNQCHSFWIFISYIDIGTYGG